MSWFRCCPICFGFSKMPDPVCGRCWQEILKKQKNRTPGLLVPGYEGLKVRALLLWRPDQSGKPISDLIHALKGGGFRNQWKLMAQEMLFSSRVKLPDKTVWTPAPAAREGLVDHANEFAAALGAISNLPVESFLRRKPSIPTKILGREERLRKADFLTARKKIGSDKNELQVVFVDDVITTGSTAREAFKRLGNPKNAEVWALACRVSGVLV